MVSLGATVTGPIEVDELVLKASEVLGVLIRGVDANMVAFCRLSGLTTWAQKTPVRKRSKVISRATGGSGRWDLLVGKSQKTHRGWGGKPGQPSPPPPRPLPCQLPSPTCGLTFAFFLSCFHHYQRQQGNRWRRWLPPCFGGSDSRTAMSSWPEPTVPASGS